ncbi:unnamed protein product [Linum trigynum]|uniref:Uncharacterized protein n=1 Tax=Linum trigynum TaxID=586398 RepID=A0AAV2CUR6_9ROSI
MTMHLDKHRNQQGLRKHESWVELTWTTEQASRHCSLITGSGMRITRSATFSLRVGPNLSLPIVTMTATGSKGSACDEPSMKLEQLQVRAFNDEDAAVADMGGGCEESADADGRWR